MTDDDGRREPADDDELADSFSIDETAAEHPIPRHGAPDEAPTGTEPATNEAVTPLADDPADQSGGAGPTPPTKPVRGRKGKPRRKAPWWELPALVALAILIAIIVKTFLVQPFFIPSQSMEKTLHGCPGCSGDRILVSKIVYDFRDPHPGDIVVFNAPPGWDDETASVPPSNPIVRAVRGFGQLIGFVPPDGEVLVKRVIAMGGQTVKGDSAGNVFISSHGPAGPYRKLDETYKYETGDDSHARFGPITVPKGRLWVMGDHRDESADSRYHCGAGGEAGAFNSTCNVKSATVPITKVIGKAFVIAWPPSRWTTLGTPKTFTATTDALAGSGVLPMLVVSPLFVFLRRRRRRK